MSTGPRVVSVASLISPHFHPVHTAIRNGDYGVYWLKGGRGSTKSSFIAIEIILGMMRDPTANCLALRKVGSTLRDSVLATFVWAIGVLGVEDKWRATTSPPELTYLPTGQKILMRGLDEPQKLKSIKVKRGYFKYRWYEELAEFASWPEIESVEQSVVRGGNQFIGFMSYNPPNDPHAWVNKEADKPVPGRLVSTSSYLDVPQEWLGEDFIKAAELMRATDPLKYDHVYLGKPVGNTEAIIFSGRYRVEDFEAQPSWDGPYQGADWGFANDPTVLLRLWVDTTYNANMRKTLYIEHEAFGVGVDMNDIPALFSKIPDAQKYKIRADCARPETISHVKGMGWDIEAAEKWPGSVEDGIEVLKSFDIVIHTRCTHMQEEARLYCYKVDRLTGDVLPIIVSKHDHGWDAGRYGLAPLIKRKPKGLFDL